MTSTRFLPDVVVREHRIDVPWSQEDPSLGKFSLFARELISDDTLPPLVYFQGGPGKPGPRTVMPWIPEALKHYRIFLIDERGTGSSCRIDRNSPELISPSHLSLLRPPNIVRDAEALRKFLKIEKWDVFGNSFGGLCVAAYMSYYPEAIGNAFITGSGIPYRWDPDEFHQVTLALTNKRQEEFFSKFPGTRDLIDTICQHLESNDERMPSGERLSANRFRMVGVLLGELHDFDALSTLLEEPFHQSVKRLRTDFLQGVQDVISLERTPLWAVIQEPMLADPEQPTNWSAQRVLEDTEPMPLLGNQFFPWHFAEDPALRPFESAVHAMSQNTGYMPITLPEVLEYNTVPCTALFYERDLFMPPEWFMEPTASVPNTQILLDTKLFHDGVYTHGGEIFQRLYSAHQERFQTQVQ
ncbi:alpha/beta fold hydrolase [Corynebacterium sp. NML180780]|uniref:alpha/beta fold hydrolase n=1 Tax=Corynebacterium sp. NML180780 TaxID=2598459 RepID=UPI00119782AC|nr:alpha/beta fold hydrolase [Corynebacterium sp. NML180780]TVX76792.1 alpha/beta fold hydrolase [Corynebacterium sp. NML180780]